MKESNERVDIGNHAAGGGLHRLANRNGVAALLLVKLELPFAGLALASGEWVGVPVVDASVPQPRGLRAWSSKALRVEQNDGELERPGPRWVVPSTVFSPELLL
eukprot:5760742-Pyramimonas_sp.AAC.1